MPSDRIAPSSEVQRSKSSSISSSDSVSVEENTSSQSGVTSSSLSFRSTTPNDMINLELQGLLLREGSQNLNELNYKSSTFLFPGGDARSVRTVSPTALRSDQKCHQAQNQHQRQDQQHQRQSASPQELRKLRQQKHLEKKGKCKTE